MTKLKKICFYSILSSGHLNVCASIGTVLLNNHPDDIEIYFIADEQWAEKLAKIDKRFKFGIIDYDNKDQEFRMIELVNKIEKTVYLSLVERMKVVWSIFMQDKTVMDIDRKSDEKIKEIKPDLLLCDQVVHLPAIHSNKIPYAFIESASPCIFNFEGFPNVGSDCKLDEKERIKEFRDQLKEFLDENRKILTNYFKEREVELPRPEILEHPISDHFTIYVYPKEVDYFDDEMKQRYKLWQIDTPLYPQRIPKPYELPKEFKELPGKIIYVSLGSLFSAYVDKLQRLVDILDRLPHKFIFSKGPNGDKLKFPSNKFIGQNYIDQLAVLQIADLMIAHGGNNTFGECFYFGCPSIIIPLLGDQINNATRIEETGYGYKLDVNKYADDELISVVNKMLNNEEIKMKWKAASERIKKEDRINTVANQIVEYIDQLKK